MAVRSLGWLSHRFRPFLPFLSFYRFTVYRFGITLAPFSFPPSVLAVHAPTHRSDNSAFRFEGRSKVRCRGSDQPWTGAPMPPGIRPVLRSTRPSKRRVDFSKRCWHTRGSTQAAKREAEKDQEHTARTLKVKTAKRKTAETDGTTIVAIFYPCSLFYE